MKISVITVAKNSASTIADTLVSVARQTYQPVEHIVIDGASSDETLSIIEREGRHVARVHSEPDSGIYDAMNKGIAQASGDVIGTLNADDVYAHQDVLQRVVAVFADPEIQACYADLVYVKRDDLTKVVRYWQSRPFTPGLFRCGWIPAHPTFFVRRELYDRYGDFDLRYQFQSDFELTMRFLEVKRVKSVYVPEIWVLMRMGGATNRSMANIIKGNLESLRACRSHGVSVGPWFFVKKFSMRIPQFFRRPGPIATFRNWG